MIVAMDAACILTTAAHRELSVRDLPSIGVAPGCISAEAAHRRPVGHCWGRGALVEALKIARPVDDLAAYDGQVGHRVRNLVFGAGKIIPIRHDEIGKLADLYPPFRVLFIGEPSHT